MSNKGKKADDSPDKKTFVTDNPDESSQADQIVMQLLGIDKPTFERLRQFIEETTKSGVNVTYEKIGKWIEENR